MTTKLTKRLIREGDFVAEVDVHLVEEEGGWSPYLSLEDAGKLDAVRDALRAGDITRGASSQPTSTGSRRSKRERARPAWAAHSFDRLQDIESDTGYDTRRRWPDGVFACVSQTAVYDTC